MKFYRLFCTIPDYTILVIGPEIYSFFSEKSLAVVSPTHVVYDFLTEIFLMLLFY